MTAGAQVRACVYTHRPPHKVLEDTDFTVRTTSKQFAFVTNRDLHSGVIFHPLTHYTGIVIPVISNSAQQPDFTINSMRQLVLYIIFSSFMINALPLSSMFTISQVTTESNLFPVQLFESITRSHLIANFHHK